MASDAEALAAGLAARQQAQDIADNATANAAASSGFFGYVLGGGLTTDLANRLAGYNPLTAAEHVLDDAKQQAQAAAKQVADVIKTVLDVVKWVAIVALIVIGILGVLWLLVAFFGLKWAASVLTAIAPSLGKIAVAKYI